LYTAELRQQTSCAKEPFDSRRKRKRNSGQEYETRTKKGIKLMPEKQFVGEFD